jgi:hypothetical protein
LLKIGVEGGEYEVLRGANTLFAKERPLLIAEVHHQGAAEQITAWLTEHQYFSQMEHAKQKISRHLFAWPSETDGQAWMRESRRRPS